MAKENIKQEKEINDNNRFICESVQKSAEHYNNMIWTILSVGIALSLWILYRVWPSKSDMGFMYLFMLFMGVLVLYFCTLAIESFEQKKGLMYKIFNKFVKKINKDVDFEKVIKDLPYRRTKFVPKIILFMIFITYLIGFSWILIVSIIGSDVFDILNFLPLLKIIFSGISLIIAFCLFVDIIINWVKGLI